MEGKRALSAPKFPGKQEGKETLLFLQRELGAPPPAVRAGVGLVRMRTSVTIPTRRRCTARGREEREPSLLGMENQVSLKAEVAELELEAVIGFNGEASSVSGLGGLQAPGTSSANRDRGTPSGTRKAARDTGPGQALSCPKALGSHFLARSLKDWDGFAAPKRDKGLLPGLEHE